MSQRRRRSSHVQHERKLLEEIPQIPGIQFGQIIGQGHFSHVYKGVYQNEISVAIKVIERGNEHSITTEIELLNLLQAIPGIIKLYQIIQRENMILVFEYIEAVSQHSFYTKITAERFKFVLKSLIETVFQSHKVGIVHRDIKLGNIMISKDFSKVKLIDWGCGAKICDSLSPRAGSRTCRSPEMLIGYRDYGTFGDIWALGIFILDVLSENSVPWKATKSSTAIQHLSYYFGGKEIIEYANSLGIDLEDEYLHGLVYESRYTINSCFSPSMEFLADPNLLNLMNRFLTLDFRQRISLPEALKHPYFK